MKKIDGGLLIAFEGGEGTGKTSQSRFLLNHLFYDCGYKAMLTREPGATRMGQDIRQILLDPANGELDPRAEALLYAADRAQHVSRVIKPAMADGLIVVTDRYEDSSIAYQGAARQLGTAWIERVSTWASRGLVPDLTVLLDMDPAKAASRRKEAPDRIEGEPPDFHALVRGAFLELAVNAPHRYLVVDASSTEAGVADAVNGRVVQLLAACARTGRVHEVKNDG